MRATSVWKLRFGLQLTQRTCARYMGDSCYIYEHNQSDPWMDIGRLHADLIVTSGSMFLLATQCTVMSEGKETIRTTASTELVGLASWDNSVLLMR